MIDDADPLGQELEQIGARFLARTLKELDTMRSEFERMQRGIPEAASSVQRMAHRIFGSGAMFGYEAIGFKAHEIEMILAAGELDPQKLKLVDQLLSELDADVRSAAGARGIE